MGPDFRTSERWISYTNPASAMVAGSHLALLALLALLPFPSSRAAYTWECRGDSTADQHVFTLLPFLFRYPLAMNLDSPWLLGFPNESGKKNLRRVLSPVLSYFPWPRWNAVARATCSSCELWRSRQIPKDYIMTMHNQKKIQATPAANNH